MVERRKEENEKLKPIWISFGRVFKSTDGTFNVIIDQGEGNSFETAEICNFDSDNEEIVLGGSASKDNVFKFCGKRNSKQILEAMARHLGAKVPDNTIRKINMSSKKLGRFIF